MPKIKVVGQTVQSWEHWQTDGRMDGRTDGWTDATKYIISLASRSIMMLPSGRGCHSYNVVHSFLCHERNVIKSWNTLLHIGSWVIKLEGAWLLFSSEDWMLGHVTLWLCQGHRHTPSLLASGVHETSVHGRPPFSARQLLGCTGLTPDICPISIHPLHEFPIIAMNLLTSEGEVVSSHDAQTYIWFRFKMQQFGLFIISLLFILWRARLTLP